MHQIQFRLGLYSRPHWATGGAYSAPQTPYLDFMGPTSKGSEGRGRGEKGKGRGGNEKGEGEEREAGPSLPLRNSLRHWVRRALPGVRDSGWPDLAWGFSDLEMTWLLYCAGAAIVCGYNLAWCVELIGWFTMLLKYNVVNYTHTHLTALFPVKPVWILLKQVSEWQWHQLGHMQVCT